MTKREMHGGDVWAVIAAAGPVEPADMALASEARRLARACGGAAVAFVLGRSRDERPVRPLASTVDHIVIVTGTGPEGQLASIARRAAEQRPALLLLRDDARHLAGALAAALGAAVVTACSSIVFEPPDRWVFRRPVYGGMASATLSSRGPAVVSVLPQALAGESAEDAQGTVEVIAAMDVAARCRVLRRERLSVRELPLTQARVVVAAGLGLGGPEAVPLVEELADVLGGTIAGTRPVIDRGWLPPDRQVGQSGALIAPRLYIACGISGAPQHLAGVRGAKTVVAINTDPGAPIMKLAHIPIVGDVRTVVPELTRAVRATSRRLQKTRQPEAAP